MKYLKKIFENTSNELPDDIQDAIINIVDELGEPYIYSDKANGITTYDLDWHTRFNYKLTFTDFNEKIEKIYKVRHDIGSVIGRLSRNYESNLLYEDGVLRFKIKTKTLKLKIQGITTQRYSGIFCKIKKSIALVQLLAYVEKKNNLKNILNG